MDDLMGMFGNSNGMSSGGMNGGGSNDLMNGFAGLDLNGSQPPPPQVQMNSGGDKKTKEDLLGLF